MKCANCVKDAFYEYKITKTKSVFYCAVHVPKFLEARRRAGQLAMTTAFTENLESAMATLATTQSEPVQKPVEEPIEEVTDEVEEEPTVDEAVEEPKPAPVKKTKKKSTPKKTVE